MNRRAGRIIDKIREIERQLVLYENGATYDPGTSASRGTMKNNVIDYIMDLEDMVGNYIENVESRLKEGELK